MRSMMALPAVLLATLMVTAHAHTQPQIFKDDPGVIYNIVESIPMGMDLATNMTSAEALHDLFAGAQKTLDIACFYMTLTGGATVNGGDVGQDLYNQIVLAAKRGVKIRIAKSAPSAYFPPDDVETLVKDGYVTAVYVNMTQLLGAGILHTKFAVADNTTFYVGSANMDWRSMMQVKELGIYVRNSVTFAAELMKVFELYWLLGSIDKLPSSWPAELSTIYNSENPMRVELNGTWSDAFFSIAPSLTVPSGWTQDQDAITGMMSRAKTTISIEVMDYIPAIVYQNPTVYWNIIDNAIRTVTYNNDVHVRLLIGHWQYSMPIQESYLQSLNTIANITVKYFNVPPWVNPVPYTRVNHAKWMVTDDEFFIDTSNWTGDYFTNTLGVGTNTNCPTAVAIAKATFERDWNSQYTTDLPVPPAKN